VLSLSLSVSIITPGSFPIPSYVTSSVESSVMNLTPLLAQKIPVTVLGKKFASVPRRTEAEGVNYVNFSSRNTKDYLKQAIHYLKKNPTSIIQVENRPKYVTQIKKYLPRATVWISLHSLTFLQPKMISRKQLLTALRLSDRIIVNSQFIKECISSLDRRLTSKTDVNYLGVDHQRFTLCNAHELEKIKDTDFKSLQLHGKKVILYVGRLQGIKGVHRLLQAISLLKTRNNDFVLLVVGGSTYGKNKQTRYVRWLHHLANQHPEHVLFIPYVPVSEIHNWYRIADVVVTPSIGHEAFGLVNVEAMATGVPVVATEIGGIPEVVKHQHNGLLVPLSNHVEGLANALYEIVSNGKWAKQLGRNGRVYVEENFTWEQAANRLYQHYIK
jgi:spore coat protein SA